MSAPVMPAGLSMTAQRRWLRELCKSQGYGRGFCKLVNDSPDLKLSTGSTYDRIPISEWGPAAPGDYTVMVGTSMRHGWSWFTSIEFRVGGAE